MLILSKSERLTLRGNRYVGKGRDGTGGTSCQFNSSSLRDSGTTTNWMWRHLQFGGMFFSTQLQLAVHILAVVNHMRGGWRKYTFFFTIIICFPIDIYWPAIAEKSSQRACLTRRYIKLKTWKKIAQF